MSIAGLKCVLSEIAVKNRVLPPNQVLNSLRLYTETAPPPHWIAQKVKNLKASTIAGA